MARTATHRRPPRPLVRRGVPAWLHRASGGHAQPAAKKAGRPSVTYHPAMEREGAPTLGQRIQGAKETASNYEDFAAAEANAARRAVFLAAARKWEALALALIAQRNAGDQRELFTEV